MQGETAKNTLKAALTTALDALEGGPRKILVEQPSPAEIGALISTVRKLHRLADGWIAALGSVAQEHAVSGNGPVLEEVLGGGGEVSRSTVSSDAGRVRVLTHFAEAPPNSPT